MSGDLVVRTLEEEPGEWWDAMVDGARSPWHGREHARLHARFGTETRFLVAERDGRPVGGVAVRVIGSRRAPVLDPLFARIALVPDEPAVPSGDRDVSLALFRAVLEEVRRLKVVELKWRVELPRLLVPGDLEAAGFAVARRGVGVMDLPPDEEGIEARMSRTARKQVRRAGREGVVVEGSADLGEFLALLDRSFRRSGLPPRDHGYVEAVRTCLAAEVLLARQEGRAVAGLLYAPLGSVALNIFHGRDDGDTMGASNLLHFEMLARCLRGGVKVVHTGDAALPEEGDSPIRGITHFKETMGFEVRPAFEGTAVLRPTAHRARAASIALWRRLRGGTG